MPEFDSSSRWLRTPLVYLGLADAKPEPRVRLVAAQASLMTVGFLMLVLALGLGAVVLAVFGWQPSEVLTDVALGVVIWGGLDFATSVHHEVPRADALPAAPVDLQVESAFRLHPSLALILPGSLVLAWLADRWDLGAFFVPGRFAGSAAANLLGAWLVHRWQRAHATTVLTCGSGGETELYREVPLA